MYDDKNYDCYDLRMLLHNMLYVLMYSCMLVLRSTVMVQPVYKHDGARAVGGKSQRLNYTNYTHELQWRDMEYLRWRGLNSGRVLNSRQTGGTEAGPGA